jgi:hypothetical protein
MSASVDAWWPRLSQETRDWLVADNGDEVSALIIGEIRRFGGLVETDGWDGQDHPTGSYLPEDVVDWVEAVGNGETPPPASAPRL